MWMLDTPNPFTPRSEMLAFLQECERIKDHDPHGKRWKGAGIPGPTGPKGSGGKTGDLRDQDGSVGYGPLGGWLAEQEMTSAVHPVQIVRATVKKVDWTPGRHNVDIGGGRYDDATNALKAKGVTNLVLDPFNRTPEHNAAVAAQVKAQPADTATVNHVLNVIKDRKNALR